MSFAFYKEVSFKGTPIGKIPKDWELVKLSDIAEDIYYGITAKAVENKTGLKMLRTTDIKDYTVDWDSLPFCEVTEKRGDIQRFLLKKGDLIIARAGTTGVSVLVEKDFENVIFGSYLIKVRLSRKVHPKFMRYFCQSRLYWDHITSSQAGSTLKNISLPVLRSLNVPLPSSIEEQQKIAEILSTVDEAIQKTNEIIAKTERLKKGLMQELLTKGIGHKEFKDTEVGRLPKNWEVVKLGDVVTYRKGVKPKVIFDRRGPNTLPYLIADDVRAGIFTKWTRESGKIVKVNKDDVILIWDGFYCGDAFIGLEGILSSTMIKIDPKPNLNGRFLFYILKTHFKELNTKISGMYLKHVNKSVFENLKLPLPPLQEQQKIVEILSTIDKKLEVEKNEKAKLERIKQGLMDLLLTGKIRVKVS